MKRIKVILFVFSLLMIMPALVNAQCEYSEKSKLQSLAGNLNFSYNYKEIGTGIDSSVDFNIIISNLVPELYIVDQTNVKVYNYNNSSDIMINGYNSGSTIQFIVYGNTDNCRGIELITNYVTLPSYNRFYKDPICNDVSNYKLCNRWTKVDLSHSEFIKRVEKYKEQIKDEQTTVIEEEISLIEKMMMFLLDYGVYLFGGIIVICSVLIFYFKRKDDFDLK